MPGAELAYPQFSRTRTGVAASARVGNLIGARLPNAAMRASHASALLSVVVGAIVMIVLIATKDVSTVPPIR